MREASQLGDGLLNLGQRAASDFGAGVIDDPMGDQVEVPFHQRMEAEPVGHPLRASMAARAVANARS